MAEFTENLNLELPDKTEQYNIAVQNSNMQKIDDFSKLTPPRALTADKLTTGANINGVLFDGSKNVITGLGLHSLSETYNIPNIAYGIVDNQLKMFKSLKDNNIGHDLSEVEWWEEIEISAGSGLPMFTPFWSDHLYNDTSYLRADNFSWHYGSIYRAGYETLEEQYNHEKSVTEIENGITYKRTPDGFKIADISQQDTIRSLYETNGIAWFYIIDTGLKRFKLPRTKWGFTGVRDGVGKPVEAGLPDIAFYGASKAQGFGYVSGQSHTSEGTISASSQNPIYGNSNTVQPPATQMYLYFYVGKSKKRVEADITEAVKIITPYFFGKSEYHKTEPNNPCLLKSQGQENYKTIYPDFYDWLLEERNNPTNLKATANVKKYGGVVDDNGILGTFSATAYADLTTKVNFNNSTWEIVASFTTGSNLTDQQTIFASTTQPTGTCIFTSNDKLLFFIGDGSSSWSIANKVSGVTTLSPNTKYFVKQIFDGSSYRAYLATDVTFSENLSEELNIASTVNIPEFGLRFGQNIYNNSNVMTGTIDLNNCYININGQRWWTGANAVKEAGTTDVITDYDYVINTENQTFILPLLNGSEDLPSGKVENLTLLASGSTYTATANGIVMFSGRANTSLSYIYLGNKTANLNDNRVSNITSGVYISSTVPVKKGDVFNLVFAGITDPVFRFTYAQGNGNLYYYVGNGVVNADFVDVATIETTKANRTDVDGQWVSTNGVILANGISVSATPTEFDITPYLPVDGYKYQVHASMNCWSSNTNSCSCWGEGEPSNAVGVMYVIPEGSSKMVGTAGYLVVGTERKIRVNAYSGTHEKISLVLRAYRRLGRNQ